MINNRLFEWLYFGVNIASGFGDIKPVTELFGPSSYMYMSQAMRKCVMPYANNKDADQPAHPRSLISVFVVRCLDSRISLVSMSKISSL